MSVNETKRAVLTRIAGGKRCQPAGRAMYRIDGDLVHIRFCSTDRLGSRRYKFNINPNTLRADWECWICGSDRIYYLVPTQLVRKLYNDPAAYTDSHHPNIRVVSVDTSHDQTLYARGGRKTSVAHYRGVTL